MPTEHNQIDVGVIGVGSMGQHHARVYNELPEANLVGLFDADDERAAEVAADHGVSALPLDELLENVDAVSIVVPTEYHYDLATQCLDANVGILIEKPVLEDLDQSADLRSRVEHANVPAQVGHIERFNPAVTQLEEIVDDLSIVSIRSQRLGPEPERTIEDSAVLDLMIHDIDVVLSVLGQTPIRVQSAGVDENRHASALLEFEDNVMASLTASRKTQQKVRTLEITAEECFIELDYIDQSLEIHRSSIPEYIEENGDVRFKHESIVERPTIRNAEPLRRELESFVETVSGNGIPDVTVEDGINALEVAEAIETTALNERERMVSADD
ncbi:Gfo/Idh/MocA family protein [Natronococcus jeotgali]|uniref:Oxidoreductase domain-containing protein n=1 Tax=Natronococcus jeotgali DSM 18795 TaxID=1227498 RepID=L9X4L7_9EURY|nr:Gfo/Idh/MocA family oxidoreductase [Natronococcus jeotgali]ELY56411.1 oxidoreductase domain-containing protein [Natronococcus jeotgali DSM 18795]